MIRKLDWLLSKSAEKTHFMLFPYVSMGLATLKIGGKGSLHTIRVCDVIKSMFSRVCFQLVTLETMCQYRECHLRLCGSSQSHEEGSGLVCTKCG